MILGNSYSASQCTTTYEILYSDGTSASSNSQVNLDLTTGDLSIMTTSEFSLNLKIKVISSYSSLSVTIETN